MAVYTVRLLGSPEVRQNGTALAFKARKALALLAYLTLEARPCAREALAELLWPDSEPDVARSALRTTLSGLRLLIGERLTITPHTVAAAWIQADDLDLRRLAAGDPDVWRGELLEGLTLKSAAFEAWLTGQRDLVRAQADRAYEQRSAALLETAPLVAADVATRWLALNRLNEAAWRRVIQAQLAAGHTGAARSTFESCQAVLRGELGVAPAPETLALAERLRSAANRVLDPTPGSVPDPVPLPAFLVGGPLVGRAAEFARLAEAYRLAASGVPQAVLISGEPGIGKTRLAGELLAWARERGAPLLRGRALEGASSPFAPLVEALGREERALRSRLTAAVRADLARLIPGAHDGPPAEPASDPRAQVLTAVSSACLALTPDGDPLDPLILLIDDLQWTDASTQDALLALATQLAETARPLLLLLTVRAEYVVAGSSLVGWLAKLRRLLPLHEERLGPLGVDHTHHLLSRSVPRMAASVQAQLTAWLYAQTAGHPLYLTETVKSLLESGALQGGRLDETRLPQGNEGVRAAIGERLARLSPASLALAQGAAILGRAAGFEVLRGVADLDDVTALTGYEELLRTGLLLEQGELAQLSHDRVRETLHEALSQPRRRLLHGRAFWILERLSSPPAVLASHALAGGLTADAATWFERAASAADEVGAQAERVAFLETSLGLIPVEPQYSARRFAVFEKICHAIVDGDKGKMDAAFAYTERYLANLPLDLREERAICTAFHAYRLSNSGRNEEAIRLLDEVHEKLPFVGRSWVMGAVFQFDSFVSINAWNWARSQWALEEHRKVAESNGDDCGRLRNECHRLTVEANLNGYAGVFDRQVEIVLESFGPGAASRMSAARRDVLMIDSSKEMYTGALCVGEIETALRVARATESGASGFDSKMFLNGYTGMMLTSAGAYTLALPYLRFLSTQRATFGRTFMMYTSSIANCAAHLGNVKEARQILDELSELYFLQTNRTYFGSTVYMMAEAYVALADMKLALFHYVNALSSNEPSVVLSSLRGIGQLLDAEGERQLPAYCLGAVLAGKVTWLRDRQQAEVLLADLRARSPEAEIGTALAEGAATGLAEVAQRVRIALAGRLAVQTVT